MLEGVEDRGSWEWVFWWKEVKEEYIVNLKGGHGIGYGGKAIGWLTNGQLFGCPNGPEVYHCPELFPVGGLSLFDIMKVLILELFCVVQVGGGTASRQKDSWSETRLIALLRHRTGSGVAARATDRSCLPGNNSSSNHLSFMLTPW